MRALEELLSLTQQFILAQDAVRSSYVVCSPGFSRFSRGDRLKPGLQAGQNENTPNFVRALRP